MPSLEKIDIFGANYYRFNTSPVHGYINSESGGIPAVPMIHTYSASMLTTTPLLAMTNTVGEVPVQKKTYKLSRFLCVQALNDDFVVDEDDSFRPTVKPHYAIQPSNGVGTFYNKDCPTLVLENEKELENQTTNIHVHDGLLSPAVTLENLKNRLTRAHDGQQSLFLQSYVVDEKHGHILVTQHCLLNNADYQLLTEWLARPDNQTTEALIKQPVIGQSVKDFQNGTATESDWFNVVVKKPLQTPVAIPEASNDEQHKPLEPVLSQMPESFYSDFQQESITSTSPTTQNDEQQITALSESKSSNDTFIFPNIEKTPANHKKLPQPHLDKETALPAKFIKHSSAKEPGVNASFLIQILSGSAIIVGLLALTGFAIGLGLAVGVSTVGVGLCTVGIAAAGLLTGFGFWCNSTEKSKDTQPEKPLQPI